MTSIAPLPGDVPQSTPDALAWAALRVQLGQFWLLEPGWAGPGSLPPSKEALGSGRDVVLALRRANLPVEQAGASPDGGLVLTLGEPALPHAPRRQVDVLIHPRGELEALLVSIWGEGVRVDCSSPGEIVEQIQAFWASSAGALGTWFAGLTTVRREELLARARAAGIDADPAVAAWGAAAGEALTTEGFSPGP